MSRVPAPSHRRAQIATPLAKVSILSATLLRLAADTNVRQIQLGTDHHHDYRQDFIAALERVHSQ